jgi:hypothetical protein
MTMGENDLCLVNIESLKTVTVIDNIEQTAIIKKYILNSITNKSNCQKAIKTTQTAIDRILEDNIISFLNSLDDKMNDQKIIAFSFYALYFNNTISNCTNKQNWVFFRQTGSTSFFLIIAHRTSFNTLIANTNAKLKSAIDNIAKTTSSIVIFVDWNAWGKTICGRFCEKGFLSNPKNSTNENAMFYKLPIYKIYQPGDSVSTRLGFGI